MEQRKRTYLLTGGLIPLIENRHKTPLSKDAKEALRGIEQAYFAATSSLLNNREDEGFLWDVKFISDITIEEDMRDLIRNNRFSRPLISFDDVYCQDLPNGHYHITRIQNPDNLDEDPILGPRFRYPSLEVQAEQIRKKYGSDIDIMDIGTFEGSTLVDEITGRLKNARIKVGNIYLAFAGKGGVEKLNSLGVDVKYLQIYDWVDWLEMRDCLGFDGRKVSMRPGLENPDNLFVRYIEKSGKWASIPEDVKEHYEELYHSFFTAIKSVLACDGIKTDLRQSKDHNMVYEFRIKKK